MAGSRSDALRRAVLETLQRYNDFLAIPGNSLDIGISIWGLTEVNYTFRDITPVGLSRAMSVLSDLTGFGSGGGTDFLQFTDAANTFFQGTLGEVYDRRINVFLTDGQGVNSEEAATAIDDLLDKDTGDFNTGAGTSVECYGANIDESLTTRTQRLDNTGNTIPIISGSNTRALAGFLRAILLPVPEHRLWTFPIEWSQGYEEEISFRTEIIISRNGTEQRIAQRINPRVHYSFASSLRTERAREAVQRASYRQGDLYFVQHPRDPARLSAAVTAGDTSIQIAGAMPSWAFSGAFVVFEGKDGATAMNAIVRTDGNTAYLESGIARSFPLGTPIRQAVEGRFDGAAQIKMLTNRVATLDTEFDGDPIYTAHRDYGAAPETIGALEYFDVAPNWSDGIELAFEQESEVLDLNRGAIDVIFPIKHTPRQMEALFSCDTPEKLDRVLGLFYRCRGRRKAFYMPLWVDELRPLGNTLDTSTTMTFAGPEIAEVYANSLTYSKLLIRRFGKADVVVDVDSTYVDGAGNSVIVLTEAVTEDILLDDIMNINWIALVRLSSDRLTLDWITGSVAQIYLNVMTLEESP